MLIDWLIKLNNLLIILCNKIQYNLCACISIRSIQPFNASCKSTGFNII